MSKRARMTGVQRREQLIQTAEHLFATNGFEATSMEEIAKAASVSKPVVYEHFGSKEAIYAVILDREIRALVGAIATALQQSTSPRQMVELAALAYLSFIETNADGFRVLTRDAPPTQTSGTYSSVIGDVAIKVQAIVAAQFKDMGYDPSWAPMYAQMLVGMTAQVSQWWLDVRKPDKYEVAAHLANLAWLGLRHLSHSPELITVPADKKADKKRKGK
ncbi:MAG: TetR/AcrR family transcriptional regulator [Actinomycetaceae bacterium]|nr:TetR/AcrR family transcriptional regulator [Actinomycetaceae bacterium]MDU0970688.1 TetR/AcrR family transcriptional regulator [Actinomycetaceae bacterium]